MIKSYWSQHNTLKLVMARTDLRSDLSLRLTHETIRPLVQLARGGLLYPNVAVLVALHLFFDILVHTETAGKQDERRSMNYLGAEKADPAT